MQTLQDIQDKIFFETKSMLETIGKINSKDELLSNRALFAEVTDRIAFLRILEKNEDSFNQDLVPEISSDQLIVDNTIITEANDQMEFNDNDFAEDIIEEEVIFTASLNDSDEEIQIAEIAESNLSENEIPLIVEQEEADYAERVAKKERDFEQMEERRRKIVEFSKHETIAEEPIENAMAQPESLQEQGEKKFKLANIKGLKVVQHLFDNDPIEEEESPEKSTVDPGSLLKTNVKTDFMEAERKKPEFRLDLNDKVAFSKSLFAGNDEELKLTIEKLNSFDNLDDAKHYLSEVYYLKDWSKVDEFAQRLWNLVESKF